MKGFYIQRFTLNTSIAGQLIKYNLPHNDSEKEIFWRIFQLKLFTKYGFIFCINPPILQGLQGTGTNHTFLEYKYLPIHYIMFPCKITGSMY